MRLRNLQDSDFGLLLTLFTDSRVREYLGGKLPFSEARKRTEALLKQKPGNYWIIEVKDRPVGTVIFEKHIDSGEVELSYQLLPEHMGKGLAFKAVRETLKSYEDSLIVAETQESNSRSRKLLKRLGFEEVRRLRRFDKAQVYCELHT